MPYSCPCRKYKGSFQGAGVAASLRTQVSDSWKLLCDWMETGKGKNISEDWGFFESSIVKTYANNQRNDQGIRIWP